MPKSNLSREELEARAVQVRAAIHEERPELSEYELEQVCFNSCKFGNPLRPIFLVAAMKLQWGHDSTVFRIDTEDGIPNDWAYRQIDCLCNYKFPQLMGCGSSGKSKMAAAYCYTMWKVRPWCTSVFFSTTSGEAAEQRGWGYMKEYYRADRYKVGALLEYRKSIVVEEDGETDKADRDLRNSIHLVLIKPGNEGDNAVAAIAGRKNDVVIWFKDESQLMTNDTTLAEINLCSNQGLVQIIDVGNAPREGTQFYDRAKPFGPGYEAGYRSIDLENATGWPTKTGYCEWFDGERSPNVRAGKPIFRGIITQEGLNTQETLSGGRDTPGFWIQGKGFPPGTDIRDTVLTGDLIQQNSADQQLIWASAGMAPKVIGGGDLGFREDGDPCVAHFGTIGACHDGVTRLLLEPHTVLIAPSQNSQLPFEDQIALKFIAECEARGCHDFQLDITGDGGIILARCIHYAAGRVRFYPKSFGGTPDETVFGTDDKGNPIRACDMFDRMVTQLWYGFRLRVQADQIRGMSLASKSTVQLCARKVVHQGEGKKISVETKKVMKKRLKRSPDDADATVNLGDLAAKFGLASAQDVLAPQEPQEDERPQERRVPYQSSGFSRQGYAATNRRSYSSR